MGEWKISDLISNESLLINDGYRAKNAELSEDGIPFARAGNINNGFHFIGADCFPIEDLHKVGNKVSLPGDVVFTSKGTVGRFAFVSPDTLQFVYSPQLCFWRSLNNNLIYSRWLYYWMCSREFYQQYIEVSEQTDMAAYVNLRDQRKMKINLPPLSEQKAIASVLSSLDDKIDLLHRQNKTLEGMAETLFRQWFVEEAEEGWKESSLLEVIQLVGGGTPKTANAEYWDGGIPWLSGGDIASNHKSFINCSAKSISEIGLNNSSAKLLPKYATVISARGTVGKYCLLAQPMAFSQSNYGIVPKILECFFFTYLIVNHVVEELQSSAYGSVFDTITTTTFKEVKISLPTETEILRFEQSVSPYFKKMLLNQSQIRTLEKLRDTLLPKLMSGEVRVQCDGGAV